ncbi:MAG: capsule assembly Wzi family protein [Halanaerobium sp.]|nr:capsule assembly Wzi family protein [Halanaerobium sp.]
MFRGKAKSFLIILIVTVLFLSPCGFQGRALAEDDYFTDYDYTSSLQLPLELILQKDISWQQVEGHIELAAGRNGVALREAYLQLNTPLGILSAGRRLSPIGPGYFSRLLLSDNIPLDQVRLDSEHNWFGYDVSATQLVAFLGEGINKQFFAHRLSTTSLLPGWEIGVSEAMMVSEVIHGGFYLPLPFLPYYLTKKIVGIGSIYDDYGDNYVGVDFTYHLKQGGYLYGELLVDEYPQHEWANNPDERAHLLGIYYPINKKTELRAEYSNVFNYVYIHRLPQNNYIYRGSLLGHWLGPDGDVIDLELKRMFARDREVKLGIRYIRKGPGNLAEDYQPETKDEMQFLSSIVEERAVLRFAYEQQFKEGFKLTASLNLSKISEGETEREEVEFGFQLAYEL